jgi:hypothetical protein
VSININTMRYLSRVLYSVALLTFTTACDTLQIDAEPSDGTFEASDPLGTPPAATCTSTSPEGVVTTRLRTTVNVRNDSCARIQMCVLPEFWRDRDESDNITGIDLVILFDTTGSMQPYINTMIQNMQQLITNLNTLTPSLRLGLVTFRDFANRGGSSGDHPFRMVSALTNDVAGVSSSLAALRAGGGGDIPESLSTALRASVDGQGLNGYFEGANMQWSTDPSRLKVVLGISDASDKRNNLPDGAATLQTAAAALRERGILFVGIGRRPQNSWEQPSQTSFNDFSTLARDTGAIVKTPGIDLNGDGRADLPGEVAAGEPAVLQMDSQGRLLGAPPSSDPTRVVAGAIAQMLVRVRPFQFSLGVNAPGRAYTPSSNSIAVPPASLTMGCFAAVDVQRHTQNSSSCPNETSAVEILAQEETLSVDVPTEYIQTTVTTTNCAPGPQPSPSPSPSPSPTGTGNPGDPFGV